MIAYLQYLNDFRRISRTDRDQAEQANSAITHLKSKEYAINASIFAIGEAVKVLSKKESIANRDQLVLKLQGNLTDDNIIPCPVEKKRLNRLMDLVRMLKGVDPYLESGDIFTIACSMQDNDCRGILTFEGNLIQSTNLQKFVEEHKARKRFIISDNVSGI